MEGIVVVCYVVMMSELVVIYKLRPVLCKLKCSVFSCKVIVPLILMWQIP